MKNATIKKTENGWHIELDIDHDFMKHTLSAFGELDKDMLDKIVEQWFCLRVEDCGEDIEQAAEFCLN